MQRRTFQSVGPSTAGIGSIKATTSPITQVVGAAQQLAQPLISEQVDKIEARAQQQTDLQFMTAARAYEQGLGQIQMQPGGVGYEEAAGNLFAATFNPLVENAPDHLREAVSARIAETGIRMAGSAHQQAEAEAQSQSRFGLHEGLETIEGEAARNPQAIEKLREQGNALIDNNPDLSPEERRNLKDALNDGLTERSETARVQNDPVARQAYSGQATAQGLLREFEGYRESPYWDVTAHRVGYGSDTITRADGTIVPVEPGMRVTRADAERDLERRTANFANGAREKIGYAEWDRLPGNAQAALISIAYNYGSVPDRLLDAARSGDVEALAQAVEGLGGDNNGVNRRRRNREAEVIRGGAAGLSAQAYGRIQTRATQVMNEEVKAQAAQAELLSAQLGVRVSAGEADEGEIDQALDDGVISASRWESLREQRMQLLKDDADEAAAIAALVGRMEAGEKANPHNRDDTNAVDLVDARVTSQVPEEEIDDVRVATVAETGVAPEAMIEGLRLGISNGDVSQFELADRTLQASPRAFDRPGGSAIKSALEDYQAGVHAGLTPQQAAQNANPNRETRADAPPTVVNKEIREFDSDELLAEFDSWAPFDALGAVPQVHSMMVTDFEVLYRDARNRGQEPEIAKQAAIDRLTNPTDGLYGGSLVASGTSEDADKGVMRHPPERFYPPINGDYTYLSESIVTDLAGVEGYAGGEWFLMPDPVETEAAVRAQQRGENVTVGYRLMFENESGAMDYVYWRMDEQALADAEAAQGEQRAADFAKWQAAREAARLGGIAAAEANAAQRIDMRESTPSVPNLTASW